MYNFVKELVPVDKAKVERAIWEIEQKYNIVVPELLKEYAMSYDGAKVKLTSFTIDGYACEVSRIIPICGDGLTFGKIVNNDREDGFISDSLYPLAANRGGDIYYWDNSSGVVYLLLTDDIENPFKISDSVADFFALLD